MPYLTLSAALLAAALAQSEPVVPFVEADAPARAVHLVAEPASYDLPFSDGSTAIVADSRCSPLVPRGIEVGLRWDVKHKEVEALRVDITDLRDGFDEGRFLTSGERPAAEKAIGFDQAQPGIAYYWRLLAKTAEGWTVAASGRFDAPICSVDESEGGE